MKKIILVLLIVLLIIISLISAGCINEERKKQKQYEKCAAGCSALLATEDYVTYHLCNEECKKITNST